MPRAIVERDEVAAGQPGKHRVGAQGGVELGHQLAELCGMARPGRGQHVAHALMCGMRQESGLDHACHEGFRQRVGQSPHLQVAAGRELYKGGAVLGGQFRQTPQRGGAHPPTGHPQPHQGAVGRRETAQQPRAAVVERARSHASDPR